MAVTTPKSPNHFWFTLTNADKSQKVVLFLMFCVVIAIIMVILASLGVLDSSTQETDPSPIITLPINPPTSVNMWFPVPQNADSNNKKK
jgi:hypothetical protein